MSSSSGIADLSKRLDGEDQMLRRRENVRETVKDRKKKTQRKNFEGGNGDGRGTRKSFDSI